MTQPCASSSFPISVWLQHSFKSLTRTLLHAGLFWCFHDPPNSVTWTIQDLQRAYAIFLHAYAHGGPLFTVLSGVCTEFDSGEISGWAQAGI